MRDLLTQTVYKFIKRHIDLSRPILLGLSGGPDSMALLYVLKKCQEVLKFRLGVAHVDHGWRLESSFEATELKALVNKIDIESRLTSDFNSEFHTLALDPEELNGNLEEACRLKRQEFFRHLCEKHNYQSVILGHHRDDQAETVLKRLFEGAPLTSCSGIRSIKNLDGLTIWRPLLSISKQEILDWLNHQNIKYFIDQTNSDPKFLRARIRNELIPLLEKHFGKGISQNLARIGEEAYLLQETIEKHVQSIWKSRINSTITLNILDCTDYEVIWLVRALCREQDCFPSREILTTILDDIKLGKLYSRYRVGSIEIRLSKEKGAIYNYVISLNRKTSYDTIYP